ncbi:hypothetical protein [Leptolyngbya sp. 'hensonii']|uniref:hypothetical protein n=1 Tax=Leptolyngbya sp. 'hensonii' TaxID=1922337 RepID=UPI0015C5590E|nr:hypothetical protein [Leptolyngbya sp. 'hensonii']
MQRIIPWLLIGLITPSALAQKITVELETIGGKFKILAPDAAGRCQVLLENKVINRLNCQNAYAPIVIGRFRHLGNLEEVLVYQEIPRGNACNGGPLYFLGIRADSTYTLSPPLDFCGGADPLLKQQGPKLFVTFPGGPPNRGTGSLPTQIWQYENGKLRKIK